ncbi:hypothetical protein [Bifidobacterium olomucense]|uniref:DUF8033 domain-containing protein n=1 Tax=Bifidobacterium olomucense TaxID=2675324 RepID=A0A7Y0EXB9_9BIFI|nr:hypothetical protein [Bifidobacterium sp. DSM 109959]NMM98138.1 hypothetical protein [Bifidobacterium sp. DSM 109959]
MERSYLLDAAHSNQKSFGGKAVVEVWRKGAGLDYELFSYGTHVATVSDDIMGGYYHLTLLPAWDYSNTTVKHVREFIQQFGWKHMTKAQIGELRGTCSVYKYR